MLLLRIGTAVALAAAVALQTYLLWAPRPQDASRWSPVRTTGNTLLVLEGPNPETFRLTHPLLDNPVPTGESVEVEFENASLSPETLRILQSPSFKELHFQRPAGPQQIVYVDDLANTHATPAGAVGTTNVEITLDKTADKAANPPREIRFRPAHEGETEGDPFLEMTATNASLQVSLSVGVPAGTQGRLDTVTGCRKLLEIGTDQEYETSLLPVTIIAEPGSFVRFHFHPLSQSGGQSLWGREGQDRVFEPFTPGSAPRYGLGVAGLKIVPEDTTAGPPLLRLSAFSPSLKPLLSLDHLKIRSNDAGNELEAGVSGNALVFGRHGKPQRVNLLAAHKMLGVSWVALDVLLSALLVGAFRAPVPGAVRATPSGGPALRPAPERGAGAEPFDVFLVHNSQDKGAVEAICEQLKLRGLKPWLDKEQIPPGRAFQDVIQQAIPNVRSAAIFFGPHGAGKWEKIELKSFISQCVEHNLPVIPVLLPGVSELPPEYLFLRELNWVRFTRGVNDPQALDALEWGITGSHRVPGPS